MQVQQQGVLGSSAIFSENREYRYLLTRFMGGKDAPVNFVMLNPSTATAETNDPTVRRCMGYARQWEAESLYVTNLFALRATNPARLLDHHDPVGPENDEVILGFAKSVVAQGGKVICAWGNHGWHLFRDQAVREMLEKARVPLFHMGLTKHKQPRHPLYLRRDREPEAWK